MQSINLHAVKNVTQTTLQALNFLYHHLCYCYFLDYDGTQMCICIKENGHTRGIISVKSDYLLEMSFGILEYLQVKSLHMYLLL